MDNYELISTHGNPGNEIKLWQINKYKNSQLLKAGKKVKYWFTKSFELEISHYDFVLDSKLSPDSSTLASVGADETIRFWRIFESFRQIENKPK